MNTINNNNNNINSSTIQSKMATSKTHTIKINFEGDSREADIPASATLAGLQAAVASAFSVDLPPRSGVDDTSKEGDLCFTYKDPDGDDIVLDQDSELGLAVRLLRGSLEVSATLKPTEDEKPVKDADPEERLYKIAARNLREYNGVPSMTPDKLTKTLALLKLSPRRLVQQGLAPKKLLGRTRASRVKQDTPQPLGGGAIENVVASAAYGVGSIAGEDASVEWNHGFVTVDQPAAAVGDGAMSASSNDEHDDVGDAPGAVKKNLLHKAFVDGGVQLRPRLLHKAFVDGGVQLRPREVRPLLLALAVKPCRLARLGLVDAKDLRAMLHAERKKADKRNGGRGRGGGDGIGKPGPHHPPHPPHPHHHPHHPGHRNMARGGPGFPPHGPRGPLPHGGGPYVMTRGGGGGGPGAGSRMMRRHHAHSLPPPPPHLMEIDGDMFYTPADRIGGGRGRRGGRGGPHGPPTPPHHMEHDGMFYAHPPPPPPHAMWEDDNGAYFVEAAGGRPGGRRGGRRGPHKPPHLRHPHHAHSSAHPPPLEMEHAHPHQHPHQHPHSFAHGPPPPPPHMEEDEEGMYLPPSRAGFPGAVRRGGRRSLHLQPHPHPHLVEEVEGGPGPHHGPPPGMRRKMRMRRARSAGGGLGQQVQYGHQHWG